jgi:hypothetical protein
VVSAADGILPQIWLDSGAYRWIGRDQFDNQFFDRDNINLSESVLNVSSAIYFEDEASLVSGFDITGQSVDLQPGQTARTQGEVDPTDTGGREFYIYTIDLGGGLLLNNGRWANPQSNFATSTDIDSKILTHNNATLVSGTHAQLLTDHNADNTAHGPAIDAKITTHNADNTAHEPAIDAKITTHNADNTAHGPAIDAKITTHNADNTAHAPAIDAKITTHNSSTSAHANILGDYIVFKGNSGGIVSQATYGGSTTTVSSVVVLGSYFAISLSTAETIENIQAQSWALNTAGTPVATATGIEINAATTDTIKLSVYDIVGAAYTTTGEFFMRIDFN